MIEKKSEKAGSKPIEPKQAAVGSRRATAGPAAPARDSKAFWRHVRQQVQARDHGFVAVLPRELADLCQQELIELGIEDPRISEAGVEFSGRLTACLQVNLWSRTASRVLCRLPHFRVGVVGELFHKTAAVQWEVWLNPSLPLLVQAHSLHSRLDHEGLIAETVLKAIQYRFREHGYPVPALWTSPLGGGQADESLSAQRVLVRIENNRCEISLDTSGRHLHQRGYRRQHGGAPMRETLAAAILLQVGWRGERPLVDGLCGAGTVAIEAALLARGIAPGIDREFLFEKWPGHEAKTWDYLRRKAREAALPSVSAAIVAVDQERRVVKIARDNAARAGVAEDIRWELADFLALQPGALGLAPGLVVLDPPYGVRTEKETDLPDLYRRLGRHLRESFPGWQVAVVAPSPELARGLGFRRQRLWHIPHGGLAICVCLATV